MSAPTIPSLLFGFSQLLKSMSYVVADERLPFVLDTAKPRMVCASRHGDVGPPRHKIAGQYPKTDDGTETEPKTDTEWKKVKIMERI